MKLSKSGIFLIVVLVIAIGLGAWVTVMTCNVLTKEPITTPSRASGGDTPQPVQPIEKPKEPDTLVISMVGDCTLASIQTGRDFDSSLRIRDAFRAEVIRVVVAECDALHTALHENVSIR